MNAKELTAPCGIDCFNCEVYEKNVTPEFQNRLGPAFGLKPEEVTCRGCRASGGCRLHWGNCDTLDCVKAEGVEFCHECGKFPCGKLMPVREGADKFPHNLKLYNLCRMKLIGIEAWSEEAALNRKGYFMGKFKPGTGSVL
jgi:hypothetical protein